MATPNIVPWWQRLLFGFVATAFTLLLVLALFIAQDIWRGHWFGSSSGAGLIHIPDFFFILIVGGMISVAMYIVVVIPLVLLWPVRSQLKHWYAFLCVAVLLPLAVFSKPWRHPGSNLHDILYAAEHLAFAVFPVLFGGVCYLLLLRRQHARFNSTDYR